MQVFERHVSPHELIVFGCEIVLISGGLLLAFLLQQPTESPGLVWRVLLAGMFCQLCLYYNDFYDLHLVQSGRALVARLVQSTGAASIVLGLVYLAIPAVAVDAPSFVRALGILIVIVLSWRLLVNRLVPTSPLIENTLIVGTGPAARAAASALSEHDYESSVVGYLSNASRAAAHEDHVPVIGGIEDLRAVVRGRDIHRIVVGPDARSSLSVGALADAKLSGVFVEDAVAAYERVTGRILIEEWRLSRLVFEEGFRVSRRRRAAKRAADIVLAGAGLVLVAPLIALTAAIVWLGSGRPIIYRQERVGQDGTVFTLYKFRSMRVDAESSGPAWASATDPRVTRVGRFIRDTRLDELPQLWNVLVGNMSFVGPRPERPCFVQELVGQIPFYHLRHVVKPGVTGWAQVRYRYADSVESAREKLRFDLYYVKHLSFAFDLTIVIDTVKIILFRRGAR
jgi:sugar transferase (PEP-CTERM system associated)